MTAHHFHTIGFAGGGNRCYWQGGFWKALDGLAPQRPREIVTVSAGSYQACFNVIGMGDDVRAQAFAWAERFRSEFAGKSSWAARPGAHFRAFLTEIFDRAALAKLKAAPEILIQISHPPAFLPASVAAPAAILLYQAEKALKGGAHSSAGRKLGFSVSWASTHTMSDPAELVEAIMSSSSVPPFLPVGRFGGRVSLDGGLVDNPPLLRLEDAARRGDNSLLLTTRYGRKPAETRWMRVVGPSSDLTVDKFTIRDPDGLRAAYELGLKDGEAFARALLAGQA